MLFVIVHLAMLKELEGWGRWQLCRQSCTYRVQLVPCHEILSKPCGVYIDLITHATLLLLLSSSYIIRARAAERFSPLFFMYHRPAEKREIADSHFFLTRGLRHGSPGPANKQTTKNSLIYKYIFFCRPIRATRTREVSTKEAFSTEERERRRGCNKKQT